MTTLNFKNIFKIRDLKLRGKSVVSELAVNFACSFLCLGVLYSWGVQYQLAERSIALGTLIVWLVYVSNYPHIVNKQTGIENAEMVIVRCIKFRHAFYKCVQSGATLYAIVLILRYCKSVIL